MRLAGSCTRVIGRAYAPNRACYGDDVASALRSAARADLSAIMHRFAAAERLPAHDDADRSSVLAAAHEAAMAAIDVEGVIGHRHPLFKRLYTLRRESGLANDRLIHDLAWPSAPPRRRLGAAHRSHFARDLVSRSKPSRDCGQTRLKNPSGGYVEIEYCKRQARGAEWKRLRVRAGGSSTPGGLVRRCCTGRKPPDTGSACTRC